MGKNKNKKQNKIEKKNLFFSSSAKKNKSLEYISTCIRDKIPSRIGIEFSI